MRTRFDIGDEVYLRAKVTEMAITEKGTKYRIVLEKDTECNCPVIAQDAHLLPAVRCKNCVYHYKTDNAIYCRYPWRDKFETTEDGYCNKGSNGEE